MCLDGQLFLAVRDRPELDQATPGTCCQSLTIRGELTGSSGPVVCQLTALVDDLQVAQTSFMLQADDCYCWGSQYQTKGTLGR